MKHGVISGAYCASYWVELCIYARGRFSIIFEPVIGIFKLSYMRFLFLRVTEIVMSSATHTRPSANSAPAMIPGSGHRQGFTFLVTKDIEC